MSFIRVAEVRPTPSQSKATMQQLMAVTCLRACKCLHKSIGHIDIMMYAGL